MFVILCMEEQFSSESPKLPAWGFCLEMEWFLSEKPTESELKCVEYLTI